MISEELIIRISNAIAKAEGFFSEDPHVLPRRAHNPGDITDADGWRIGTTPSAGPHAAPINVYATDDDGWRALHQKVRRMLSGSSHTYTLDLSIMGLGLKWSGDPVWAHNVARDLGVAPDTTLAEIVAADLKLQGQGLEERA